MTRYTAQILEIISEAETHLNAEEVWVRLREKEPKVVMATVYNNLNRLAEELKIRRLAVEGWPDRYDVMTRHDHLVCRSCGALEDICLNDLTEELQAQIPERLLSYDLRVMYICPRCRSKEQQD